MRKHYFFKAVLLALVFVAGFSLPARLQNSALMSCDFSVAYQGYSTGTITSSTTINGESVPIHSQTAFHSRWQRIDSVWASLSEYNYPVSYQSNWFFNYMGGANTPTQGVMLMTMQDQIGTWGGTGTAGNFDAYIAFPAFSTANVANVRMTFFQAYRCFNNDKCWVDYSTDNQNWSAVEINVRNIDVAVNSYTYGWKKVNLPISLGNQNNVYLRLRWSCNNNGGGAYGYWWLLDDVTVTETPQYDMRVVSNDLWGVYGTIPQGMQVPVTYTSRITNMGTSALQNVTASVYGDNSLLGQDIVTIPMAGTSYAIVDRSGYFTDTSYWNGATAYGGFNYSGGTFGTIHNGGMMPSATAGSHTLTAYTTMPNGMSTDTLVKHYNVDGALGDKIWAWDNGTMNYDNYECAGTVSGGGYWSSDPEQAGYDNSGYVMHIRYRTGDSIPQGWVIRGMQIVASSSYTEPGAEISPVLYKDSSFYDDSTGQRYTRTVLATGAGSHIVTEGELNYNDTLEYGDTISDYNVITMMFPQQPPLQPNMMYRLGYSVVDGSFLPATDNDWGNKMGYYDCQSGYYGMVWHQPSYHPMIRMIVGPYQWIPKYGITFNCPTQGYYEIYNGNFAEIDCGSVDSVYAGVSETYYIYTDYGSGETIDSVFVDGNAISFINNSYTDDDGVDVHWVEFTLDSVVAAHTITFSVIVPLPTVSLTGPASVLSGDTALFQAIVSTGSTVTWSVQGTNAILNASNPLLMQAVWDSVGTWLVVATATNSTGSTSDSLWVNVISCDPITSYPYAMGFETWEPTTCWHNYGNNTYAWVQYIYSETQNVYHSGNGSLGSLGYEESVNNWLETPVLQLPADAAAQLSFYSMVYSSSYSPVLSVYVKNVTTGTQSLLSNYYSENGGDWMQHTLDLSNYAGQNVRIAFNHVSGSSYYSYAMIDDLLIDVVQMDSVTIACSGAGSGMVVRTGDYSGDNRCGQVDYCPMGFVASYDFVASEGSELTNLYVNNVDRINDVWTSYNGTYGTVSRYSFAVSSTANSIQAVFSRISYQITATSADPSMGMVTGGGTYFYDSTVVVTATAMPHYHFSHWVAYFPDYDEYETVSYNPLEFEAFENIVLTAYFEPDEYLVTVAPNNPQWGMTQGGGEFTYLDPVTVTATAYSGYHFYMWSNGSTYNPYTFPATEDLNLTAIFLDDNDTSTHYFNVTTAVNDPAMGHVGGGGVYLLGDTATLTAEPYDGHHFVQWQDGNTDNPRMVIVTGDVTYTAYFAPDQTTVYTITVLSSNEEWGTVTGGGQYNSGEEATLTATPFDGFFFVGWDDGDVANPRTITVTGDATYMAVFDTVQHESIDVVDAVDFTLYPNPASTQVTISLDNVDGSADVVVADLSGRVLMQRSVRCDGDCQTSIEVTGLAQGAYFVRVASERGFAVKKLIVK